MISPYDCATQFNKLVNRASDSTNNYQDRVLAWCQAQIFYYCLTGTSLRLFLNEYLANYDIKIDNTPLSQLEVDNYTGERVNSPIRRFLNMLFPKL